MNEVQVPSSIRTPVRAPSASIDWREVRARYPSVNRSTFLNITSGTPLSNAAKAAVDELIDGQWLGTLTREERNRLMVSVRERFAQLVHGKPGEVAVTKNVSEGLNIVASAIDWKAGDNVVVCPELEHPNNIYVWLGLGERGVKVRAVPAKNGAVDTEAMIAAIDARTRIVTVASVTFVPGFRTELAKLGHACRRSGALFLVDAVQSCGILDIDVEACAIDALATSTSKGLMGIAGFGFLYVRSDWITRLRPVYLGRYSIERTGHESEFESDSFRLLADARRFEAGNYNWAGVAAANASLGELLQIGTANIEPRAVKFATALADGLGALGLTVAAPPAGVARSHIVTVGTLGAGDAQSSRDPKLNRIGAALTAAGVKFTVRKGMLRFGFHCYNDESDVERVLEVVRGVK